MSSAKELGVADSAQLRWVIVEHMMREYGQFTTEYGQFTTEGLLEDAEKVFQYVVNGKPALDLAEIDRNARGYGWEAGVLGLSQGDDLPEELEVHNGNPFVRDDRQQVER